MKQAVAFAPCHITGVFQIFDESSDPLYVGSRGAGVSLRLGVRTAVKINKAQSHRSTIHINNRATDSAQVSENVVNAFLSHLDEKLRFEVRVEHRIEAPIGAGFGTSGAAALSLALALNEALDLGLSKTEAAQISHVADVECKTGLGTVIAETYGGVEIRVKPGAPGIGEVKCLPVPENTVVACDVFGALSTSKLLADPETRSRVGRFGGGIVEELMADPTLINFMRLSRQFAEHVGLITPRVRGVLNAADKAGVVCSMPMFGESVFTIIDEENAQRILRVFSEHSPNRRTIVTKVNREGARLIQ
jgi:pantoate kinase